MQVYQAQPKPLLKYMTAVPRATPTNNSNKQQFKGTYYVLGTVLLYFTYLIYFQSSLQIQELGMLFSSLYRSGYFLCKGGVKLIARAKE